MHHRSDRKVPQSVAYGLLICTALAALAVPLQAQAQFVGTASASAGFSSNSNVFDLDTGITPPGTTGSRRSDTDYTYGAAFGASYLFGQQQVYATANTTQFRYDHFTQLNNNAYNLDAGLNWKLADNLYGKVDIARTHAMVPFVNLSGSELDLTIATSQTESGLVGLKLGPDWKIEGTGSNSRTDEPIAQAPDLRSSQTSGTTSLEYLGFSGLSGGLTLGYLTGDYSSSNTTQDSSYSQRTAGLLANYKLGHTSFDGQIGYSSRSSTTGLDDASGLTGLLDFKDQLTPKTSFMVKIDRTINSYVPQLGSEIDTDVGGSVDWQATYKIAVSLGYTFTYRDYPPQELTGLGYPPGAHRSDYQHYGTLEITYQPLRWLSIKPYANVQTRDSNVAGGDFNATIFGVTFTATTPDTTK
ncbi:MAG TPA: outer membrane beta-barrel protein [Steroidobacteraceae bacterium]|nr:outer membrane beta-barrel protein [Steroidobacteraceae bacterium]